MSLLTIAAIAKRLGIPEATVRYYRDRFEPWIPAYGEGRDRRYGEESVEVLRFIADAMKANIPADSIKARLSERFPTTQEAQPPATTTQQQAAAVLRDAVREVVHDLLIEQQQATALEARQLREVVESLRAAVVENAAADRKTIADQAAEIGRLRSELARLPRWLRRWLGIAVE